MIKEYTIWRRYLARFAPVFVGAYMMSLLSLGLVIPLAMDVYFRDTPDIEVRAYFFGLGASLFISTSYFLVVQGYSWAAWIIFTLFVLCLSTTLPTYPEARYKTYYWLALLAPLFGLYLLHSRSYRRFTKILRVNKRKQKEMITIIKLLKKKIT
jgi:hypothetical protein